MLAERVTQLKASLTLAITAKVKVMRKNGIDVIGFGAGEPDFDTPANIKKAGRAAISSGFTKYTPSSGILELKTAVCKKLKKDNSLIYKPEEIAVSCGAKHTLYNILQVLCEKGDEVIVISPYWVSYTEMVILSGAKPCIVEAKEENAFLPDPEEIEKRVTARTKAIIINSPSNPTGAVFGKKILSEIAQIAVSHDIFVISDEIYEKFIYEGEKHISIASLNSEIKKLTLTVNGVSKTYSMTGWRIGYTAGPETVIKAISALQSHSTSNPCSISQMAALEALNGSQAGLREMKKEFAARRDYAVRRINSVRGISCIKPKGAFYIFCNIEKTGLDSATFCMRLLEEARTACVPGIAFGSDKYARLSFATNMGNIRKGLDRIEGWLKKI